ncbi:hypothetical protein JZ751_017009 [Albula glossodonta]|uniref:Uncharacterized protein n=1 Tax=Albula glossodonta TaxID=121402 RepID=A0A8T2MIF5_9TELE|nr:hypothetical protein JZ751_017009 [Albula glossodonta]
MWAWLSAAPPLGLWDRIRWVLSPGRRRNELRLGGNNTFIVVRDPWACSRAGGLESLRSPGRAVLHSTENLRSPGRTVLHSTESLRSPGLRAVLSSIPQRACAVQAELSSIPQRACAVRAVLSSIPQRTCVVQAVLSSIPQRACAVRAVLSSIPQRACAVRASSSLRESACLAAAHSDRAALQLTCALCGECEVSASRDEG